MSKIALVMVLVAMAGCAKSNERSEAGSGGAGSGGKSGSSSAGSVGESGSSSAGSGGRGGSSSAGSGGRVSASGRGGGGGQGGSGGSTGCAQPCGDYRECCVDHCVNLQNDPQNCGTCGERCADGEYCTEGRCKTPACMATCGGGARCCETECCAAGKLCCDPQGPVSITPHCVDPNEHGTCPVGCAPLCMCAHPETPIGTPSGDRPIASLQAGDLVYSIDRGQLAIVPIIRTRRTEVSNHQVVRLALQNGSVLQISPGHPTVDGRRFDTLVRGERLDGVEILAVDIVPYGHDATYDILPDSDTGAYFAGGVLIGSTLAEAPLSTQMRASQLASARPIASGLSSCR